MLAQKSEVIFLFDAHPLSLSQTHNKVGFVIQKTDKTHILKFFSTIMKSVSQEKLVVQVFSRVIRSLFR